ncbi:hypothetical protein L798_09394 [Zootermopsis nevadensis]|uniref:Uncharacterized protein n=1 Tax=Zootermopsis nevadensis TaxID=136037 RepID=A0A067RW11_ZOONE|nr:hypothetical protein L798_09394 [Zootermopsis nevadensis]
MPRDETSLSSQDTGKLMGRDTEVTKLSVLEDDQGTLPRESSSEVVSTETTERSRSNMLNATDKGKGVENKPSGELKNIKSFYKIMDAVVVQPWIYLWEVIEELM